MQSVKRVLAPACIATGLLAALIRCGDIVVPLIGRLPSESSGDSGALMPDAGGDSGAPGLGPFGVASPIAALADPNTTEDPSFTADERELYFMSSRAQGNQDIWVSHRLTSADPWGSPQRVAELSSTSIDRGPCVARDGLTIWLASDRDNDGGTGQDIWVSSRAGRTDPWSTPQRVAQLASSGIDTKPSVDDAELVIVFVSNRPGGVGGLDLYMSSRSARSDPWGSPVDLTDVNTTHDEWDPFISGDDRELYWAADFPVAEEIRWVTRASGTHWFLPYHVLSELGTPASEPTFSVDLRHVMFASSRSGVQQIYEAFR